MHNYEALIFDPCEDSDALELLMKYGTKNIYIFLTHEHHDHVTGVNWLKENIRSKIYCQEECRKSLLRGWNKVPALTAMVLSQQDKIDGGKRYELLKKDFRPFNIKADVSFIDETIYNLCELSIKAKPTPGHSPGSTCYSIAGKIVFTGDSLLQNNSVITRFRNSNKNIFEEVTLPFLRSLPKDTIIMPGHGDPFVLKDTEYV